MTGVAVQLHFGAAMRIPLERRTADGLALRVAIESADVQTHEALSAVHASDFVPLGAILRESLDRVGQVADQLICERIVLFPAR